MEFTQKWHLFTLMSFQTCFFYEMGQATGKYLYCFFQIFFFFTNTNRVYENQCCFDFPVWMKKLKHFVFSEKQVRNDMRENIWQIVPFFFRWSTIHQAFMLGAVIMLTTLILQTPLSLSHTSTRSALSVVCLWRCCYGSVSVCCPLEFWSRYRGLCGHLSFLPLCPSLSLFPSLCLSLPH